MITEDHFYRHP